MSLYRPKQLITDVKYLASPEFFKSMKQVSQQQSRNLIDFRFHRARLQKQINIDRQQLRLKLVVVFLESRLIYSIESSWLGNHLNCYTCCDA